MEIAAQAQCAATTQTRAGGKRCRRRATHGSHCWQHAHANGSPVKRPAQTHAQRELQALLARGPRTKDVSGLLYCYALRAEWKSNARLWKVGRTTRDSGIEARMREWGGTNPLHLVRALWTPFAAFSERVVHLLLDECRVYRWSERTDATSFRCTLSKHDNGGVPRATPEERATLARECRKQIEWFSRVPAALVVATMRIATRLAVQKSRK